MVVIGILALVFAIVLPALVNQRREVQRVTCVSNLHQLALALLEYINDHSFIPPAGDGQQDPSWVVPILPYLGEQSVHDALVSNPQAIGGINVPALRVLVCPTDGMTQGTGWAGTSYAGNRGSGFDVAEDGCFARNRQISLADFTDGTNATVAASEWLMGRQAVADRDPERSVFQAQATDPDPAQRARFIEACTALDPSSARQSTFQMGIPWTRGGYGHSLYNHLLTPGRPHCLNGTDRSTGAWTAKSHHLGGVNVVMVDGSHRFVTETVEPWVWSAMGTRSGRDTPQCNDSPDP